MSDLFMAGSLVMGGGLGDLWSKALANWVAPVFFAAVAVGAFMFIRSQQLTKLILFLVVAAIVGVLIFAGDAMFGSNGVFKNMFQGVGNSVAGDGGGLTN